MAESPTYSFDPKGREQFIPAMKDAEYAEFPTFKPHLDSFCCYSCEYMCKAKKSPTGFWCSLKKFPDDPKGCCRWWRPAPGLIQNEEAKQ